MIKALHGKFYYIGAKDEADALILETIAWNYFHCEDYPNGFDIYFESRCFEEDGETKWCIVPVNMYGIVRIGEFRGKIYSTYEKLKQLINRRRRRRSAQK